ncbi:MAG: alpha/beta fold hydrolase BchO [Pseudomonadota bacterium]
MDWARDLESWSHPSLSRRIDLSPIRWHVQEAGDGPLILLLHGTGASTHTWRDVIHPLAEHYRVIAVDLPGHGFTKAPLHRMGLHPMVQDLRNLIDTETWAPVALIGHSAGAAIAVELAETLGNPKIVGLNPALENFPGVAAWLFPMVAKFLAMNPFTANLFSFAANRFQTTQIITGTGSKIGEDGLKFYTRLMQDRDHVNGALQMMAQWSLDDVAAKLPSVTAEALFLTGDLDKSVPPSVARRAAERMPHARVEMLTGLGHLAHEEDPVSVAKQIVAFVAQS